MEKVSEEFSNLLTKKVFLEFDLSIVQDVNDRERILSELDQVKTKLRILEEQMNKPNDDLDDDLKRTPVFKRLTFAELEDSCVHQQETEISKEKALELIRLLLDPTKEHVIGLKISFEKLKTMITQRVNNENIKIEGMTAMETADYLIKNFY